MADREVLRRALLNQLKGVELASIRFRDTDGHGSIGINTNEQAAELAVDTLLPLIEQWTQNVILVSTEEWDQLQDTLDAEPKDLPRLRELLTKDPSWEDTNDR